jgi:hypothetical protein
LRVEKLDRDVNYKDGLDVRVKKLEDAEAKKVSTKTFIVTSIIGSIGWVVAIVLHFWK